MRNVVLYMQSTLNGMAVGPDEEMDWLTVNDQTWEIVGNLQEQCDTALIGRNTYGEFVGFWPAAADDPGNPPGMVSHARWLADTEKLVASRTLDSVDWQNSRLLGDDFMGEIARMKKGAGKDLLLLGGVGLVRSMSEHDLIDEYWLLVNPATISSGQSALASRRNMRLLEAKPFDSGVVALHYARG